MTRPILKLIVKSYLTWLSANLQPSGRPLLHDIEARCIKLIDSMPEGVGPSILEVEKIDEAVLVDALEWIFKTLGDSQIGDNSAVLCSHLLRFLARQAAVEVIRIIVAPLPKLDH